MGTSTVEKSKITAGDDGLPKIGVALYEKVKATDGKFYNRDRSIPRYRFALNDEGDTKVGPNLILWEVSAPKADGSAAPQKGPQFILDKEVIEEKTIVYHSIQSCKYGDGVTLKDAKNWMSKYAEKDLFADENEAEAEATLQIVKAVLDKVKAGEAKPVAKEAKKGIARAEKGEALNKNQLKAVGKMFAEMVS